MERRREEGMLAEREGEEERKGERGRRGGI